MRVKVVADLGEQRVVVDGSPRYLYLVLLSCGCRVAIDVFVMTKYGERRWMDMWLDLLAEHVCPPNKRPIPNLLPDF